MLVGRFAGREASALGQLSLVLPVQIGAALVEATSTCLVIASGNNGCAEFGVSLRVAALLSFQTTASKARPLENSKHPYMRPSTGRQ
jgi:hypothetical protein